jgi:molybdopterin molybdotransferase
MMSSPMTATHSVHAALEAVPTAQRRLLSSLRPLPAESVELGESVGRILAEAVMTTAEHPAFDNSAMDGYAVRAADVAAATQDHPVALPVVAEAGAGELPAPLPAQSAIRIMTGAPLPPGADAVVRQEDTSRRDRMVLIAVAAAEGSSGRSPAGGWRCAPASPCSSAACTTPCTSACPATR